MRIILNEKENTLTMGNDLGDAISIYRIKNVKETRAMIKEIIDSHVMSDSGTTIITELVSGSLEEIEIP